MNGVIRRLLDETGDLFLFPDELIIPINQQQADGKRSWITNPDAEYFKLCIVRKDESDRHLYSQIAKILMTVGHKTVPLARIVAEIIWAFPNSK